MNLNVHGDDARRGEAPARSRGRRRGRQPSARAPTRVCAWALALSAAALTASPARALEWLRAGLSTNQPIWGIQGGLKWAIAPGGFGGGEGGPRGLLRLGYPILTHGGYALVNFIAVEPIVRGQRAFSELEPSRLDSRPGKRFWCRADSAEPRLVTALLPGTLRELRPGVEQLEVSVGVERFDNGAQVRLEVAQRGDAPDEIRLTVYAEAESAPLDYCILTATMGNFARTRWLWLKAGARRSLELYPDYRGEGFTEHRAFPLNQLHQTAQGDVLVAVTTDEADPAAVFPFPGRRHWYYGGHKVTQYWRKPAGEHRSDLEAIVNARYTYWQSRQPIPGGVAFENFELRERFHAGQQWVFGITRRTPAELGFPP